MMNLFKSVFLFFGLITAAGSYASNAEFFNLNLESLNHTFSDLHQLEAALVSLNISGTNSKSFDDLIASSNLNLSNTPLTDDPYIFQWEGFLWGFLCCPVGFFTIAVNKRVSKDNKLSYWWGVFANTVLAVLVQTTAVISTINQLNSY